VVEILESLYMVGITRKVCGAVKTIKAKLFNGIFSLVAKATIINVIQFKGKRGSLACTHTGSHLTQGCHVYLPKYQPLPATLTHSSIMKAALQELEYQCVVLEGDTRWLLPMWFKSENHREPYLVKQMYKGGKNSKLTTKNSKVTSCVIQKLFNT